MKVYRSLSSLPKFQNSIITIGSFDGVHSGHQEIIYKMNSLAKALNSESIVITFDPHPKEIIFPNAGDFLLINDQKEKIDLLSKYGIDNLVIIPFTVHFSQQHPEEYIEKFLIDKFSPKIIVIGYDHRFGINRSGDIKLLKSYEEKGHFDVIEISKQKVNDISVSSTKIRAAVASGNIIKSNHFLGHPFTLSGKIIHGNKIGSKIGFPTANVKLHDVRKLVPKDGVYAVTALIEELLFKGMLYIGDRPTVMSQDAKRIELNLFDFQGEIYDTNIIINFYDYIREDVKFASLEKLKDQLFLDQEKALAILDQNKFEPKPEIAIAILNFNGREYLERFLPSVLYSSKQQFDIYIIDNASTDDSIGFLKEWYPEINIIRLDKNHGFAKGYQLGLKNIKNKYVLLLNNDVKTPPDWLDNLYQTMEKDPAIFSISPQILSLEDPSKYEYAGAAGGYLDKLGFPFCRGRIFDHIESNNLQYRSEKSTEAFWTSGAAMLVRNKVYKSLGGFDPSFFAHMEEIDLCWRAKRAGYKCIIQNDSSVFHLGGGTLNYQSPHKTYLNFRNNLFMIAKNDQSRFLILKIILRLILDGTAGVNFLIRGEWQNSLSVLKAHLHFYTKIPRVLKQRKVELKAIQKTAIIDKENTSGRFNKSIVWQYFIRQTKLFSELDF